MLRSPDRAPVVDIVSRSTGVGIDRDVELLRVELERGGFEVRHVHARERNAYLERAAAFGKRLLSRPGAKPRADLCLMLEKAYYRWCWLADHVYLIPNQEWFDPRLARGLPRFDGVLCKTRHALEIFSDAGARTDYLGFTSVDRLDHTIEPDYRRFLHLAGRSRLKGTEAVLGAWREHPEWPPLLLLQQERQYEVPEADNIEVVERHLREEELRSLLNGCGVHLCPSHAEGWGHHLVEAMSCRAVVVTTDGPPMNELVRPERGVLVPWAGREPRKMGFDFTVAPEAIEGAVGELLARPVSELETIGARARSWFEENDRVFRERLGRLAAQWAAGAVPADTV
jgi:glycosyltransferase involved in cell wall biosynthesis